MQCFWQWPLFTNHRAEGLSNPSYKNMKKPSHKDSVSHLFFGKQLKSVKQFFKFNFCKCSNGLSVVQPLLTNPSKLSHNFCIFFFFYLQIVYYLLCKFICENSSRLMHQLVHEVCLKFLRKFCGKAILQKIPMYLKYLRYIVLSLLRGVVFFRIAAKEWIYFQKTWWFFSFYILLHLMYSNYPFLLIQVVSFLVFMLFHHTYFLLLLNKL